MTGSFSTETSVTGGIKLSDLKLERTRSDRRCLDGVRVLVITSGHEATDHRIYGKEAMSLKRFGAEVTVVGALDHPIPGTVPVVSVSKARSRLVRFVLQPWCCLWAARKLPAEIIHFHDPEMLAALPAAKLWWPRAKFVYDVHEDFANLALIRDWLPDWLKPLVKAATDCVEKALALLADAIVGVTPPLAEKFPNKQRIVAYNYIPQVFFDDAAATSKEPRERPFDLVHLGTLNLRRARFLASVLQEYHRLRPGARCLVVGVSPQLEKAMRVMVPERCVFRGKVPHKEIPGLLGSAKIGLDVHPWLGAHLKVALPVKVCEYMAAGCAVVSSSMPVLNHILHEAAADLTAVKLIDGGDPIDYARAVSRLVEAIEKGGDPGSELRELALRHMTWENEAAKIAQLYLRIRERPCVT